MEPMNCVVKLSADACEIWNGEQFPVDRSAGGRSGARHEARAGEAQHCSTPAAAWRRANPHADYVVARRMQIAKAHAEKVAAAALR